MISNPIESNDGTASFIQILKLYAPNAQRNFDEAKGLVINEYQNYLEEKWIESLKKKYPVKINDAVFKAMVQ